MSYADIYQAAEQRQADKPVLWCDLCQGEIYPQQEYYFLTGRNVCRTCLETCCVELFGANRRYAPDPEVRS